MMMQRGTKPRMAIITTKGFRASHKPVFINFVRRHLVWLIENTELWMTGHSSEFLLDIVGDLNSNPETHIGKPVEEIKALMESTAASDVGIISVANELVEGHLSAVFHLAHYKEVNEMYSQKVLKRQALVHNVAYVDNSETAWAMVEGWRAGLGNLERKVTKPGTPIVDIERLRGKKNIALISHNGKKLDLCWLVTEYLPVILKFDYLLATGTTAHWLSKFLVAASRHMVGAPAPEEIEAKIIPCRSGPHGGDVQVMHAVVNGVCDKVIFLIDPHEAHPNEPDINLFEQVIEQTPVVLTTNIESARCLLNTARAAFEKKELQEEYQKFWLQ